MNRSSKPSPFTSPALLTDLPLWSSTPAPKIVEPCAAVNVARSITANIRRLSIGSTNKRRRCEPFRRRVDLPGLQ